ncbi:hypothetical protein LCM4577_23340 [Mesorhizobium sp. LCM 4577]|nr:hypothetical protein LCM4576_34105 [Mesorhizobium sp. LCM 4576]OHV69016.1 hypothetical protein LCM4577_23340 [Mesorhizobium sp. LCM 4577]
MRQRVVDASVEQLLMIHQACIEEVRPRGHFLAARHPLGWCRAAHDRRGILPSIDFETMSFGGM